MTDTLQEMLIRHEGLRLHPYRCSEGYLTIGVGRNLEIKGISEEEAMEMLNHDISQCLLDLDKIFSESFMAYLEGEDSERAYALCDMRFQLGASGFRSFSNMIQAIKDQDWNRAADEALNSLWAQQTPERAREIAEMIRNGG
jgi:lysozyme